MGLPMTCRSGSTFAISLVLAIVVLPFSALAAELPAVLASAANPIPQCATPGRLMAYVRERNPKLAAKYDGLATDYMRMGERLGLRWDYAFFQMLLETAYLTYTGDVRPEQNNFAGLGATGNGARGESFKDVATGARAHLEHLLMYAGSRVENPVAERTRNVQDWGVLTSWQKQFKRPITFTDVAKQWAPGSRGYSNDVATIAGRFYTGQCSGPDPRPELVAEARGEQGVKTALAAPKTKGQEAAERAVAQAREEGASRSALGAVATEKTEKAQQATGAVSEAGDKAVALDVASDKPRADGKGAPKFTILNATPTPPGESAEAKAQAVTPDVKAPEMTVASVAGTAASAKPDKKAKPAGTCRVWTASYGGERAVIIKALTDKIVHYTVLDVNDGTEKREAEAYINAYAKGGEQVGEFGNHALALEKAFDLCPEG